ncbi:hypothetical protein Theco_4110 (plasmid) [Thermobacillus composti KWC4]|jgi:hypothetical protein|uniref:Transposase n=1 Tax=Thermobacillus composti (strain DSM 18247 / JCM 13945 / KWC4) TaxID=717605 RepID=L0EJY4_THECK|nr:hypothetical protein [Thermobacillus composti]AGA60106.1 hypothetical protein Theco_4110 [Thermobacillus composti KWC4]
MTSREQRRQLWAARIADFRASGLTMSAWCAANHCTIDQLKYWLYKAKNLPSSPSSASPTRWVPLMVADPHPQSDAPPSLVVCIGKARIELQTGFDPGLLRDVVRALGEASC